MFQDREMNPSCRVILRDGPKFAATPLVCSAVNCCANNCVSKSSSLCFIGLLIKQGGGLLGITFYISLVAYCLSVLLYLQMSSS